MPLRNNLTTTAISKRANQRLNSVSGKYGVDKAELLSAIVLLTDLDKFIDDNFETELIEYVCPSCDMELEYGKNKCPNCKRRISWR